MIATNIESKVKKILENSGGWLRVSECAKQFAEGNASEETRFYRWRKQVEKSKVKGFQALKLPGNISFIGLDSADPKTLETLISEDKKAANSIRSGFGFWAYLNQREERKDKEKQEQIKECEAKIEEYTEKILQGPEEAKRRLFKS